MDVHLTVGCPHTHRPVHPSLVELHVSGQDVRYQIGAQVHFGIDKDHLFRRFLVQPAADHRPDGGEDCRRVENEAHAQPLRVVFAQQPDDVLDQLVVHAGRAELGQVEHDAQVVRHLLKAFAAGDLLWRRRRRTNHGEFVNFPRSLPR